MAKHFAEIVNVLGGWKPSYAGESKILIVDHPDTRAAYPAVGDTELYSKEAREVFEFLKDALPGGTWDQLARKFEDYAKDNADIAELLKPIEG